MQSLSAYVPKRNSPAGSSDSLHLAMMWKVLHSPSMEGAGLRVWRCWQWRRRLLVAAGDGHF
ncbi:hypothetical protein ART_2781 [Arthrobacter sp. PAMC 25486]|nr:hypothetical protein ART_2781 [Arthrobacter sp. PAMC 25486]